MCHNFFKTRFKCNKLNFYAKFADKCSILPFIITVKKNTQPMLCNWPYTLFFLKLL